MDTLQIYDYYRSSCSYRVRIALNLKGLSYDRIAVDISKGEQAKDTYREINPQSLVPALQMGDNFFSQSLAIIEWLESYQPQPELLSNNLTKSTHIRALANHIAMDIQPLNNLRVLNYFRQQCDWQEEQVMQWYHHWVAVGFTAIEQLLQGYGSHGDYCYDNRVSLADVCLVPQVYNAKRFGCDLSPYPLINSIDQHCNTLTAFAKATPEAVANV